MEAYNVLVEMLRVHAVARSYHAVVFGMVAAPRIIDAPIGRDRVHRTKMAIHPHGKPAITYITPLAVYPATAQQWLSKVLCILETGRTHQIRVHMQSIGLPLVGDATYGAHKAALRHAPDWVRLFGRQALHAVTLRLHHPITQQEVVVESPYPHDFADLLTQCEQCSLAGGSEIVH